MAVENGQTVGFLALKPGHFCRRDFIDSYISGAGVAGATPPLRMGLVAGTGA